MAKSSLGRRTLKLPFVVVPLWQFPVDELDASAVERDEPVAVEPSPAGLDSVEQLVGHRQAGRPPARPLGRALGPRDCCINGDGAHEGWQSRWAGTSGVGDNPRKTAISQQAAGLLGALVEGERADRLMQQCHLRDRSAGRSHQLHGVAFKLSTGHAARSSSPVSHEDIFPLRDCTASGKSRVPVRRPWRHGQHCRFSDRLTHMSTCSPRSHKRSSDAGY